MTVVSNLPGNLPGGNAINDTPVPPATSSGNPGLPTSVVRSGQQGGTSGAPTPKTVWSFQPADATKGPAQIAYGGAAFNGVWDFVLYFGHNVNTGGGKVLATDTQFYLALEHSYVANPGGHTLEEAYIEWTSADSTLTIRPWFIHVDATAKTATLEFQVTGLSLTDPTTQTIQYGGWGESGITLGGPTGPNNPQTLALQPGATNESSIQLYRYGGTAIPVLAFNTISNTEAQAYVNGHSTLFFFDKRMAIGIEDNSAALTIQDQGGGYALQTLDGPAGQAQDHYRATNAAKTTVYSRIDPSGYIATAKNAAPSTAGISNGEVKIWLDATPGATKVNFIAKDSGGTVRSAVVALA